MDRIKKFIQNELLGWRKLEALWMLLAIFIMLSLSLYWKESFVGIVTGLTGIMCVILTGKGKLSSYLFGLFNTVLYAYIAFGAKYYGEVMLNLLYYLPMNFVGWVMWKKHLDGTTQEVIKQKLTAKWEIMIAVSCGICVYGYGMVLKSLGGNLPFVDSLSTVLSIFAQILCVKRYMEQWVLWIVVDVVTVIMWAEAFINGGESVATLIMWSVYLLNAIFMFVKWYQESKKNDAKGDVEECIR